MKILKWDCFQPVSGNFCRGRASVLLYFKTLRNPVPRTAFSPCAVLFVHLLGKLMWKCPIGFCFLGRRTQAFPLTWVTLPSSGISVFRDRGMGENYAGVQEEWAAGSPVSIFTAREEL